VEINQTQQKNFTTVYYTTVYKSKKIMNRSYIHYTYIHISELCSYNKILNLQIPANGVYLIV